MRSAPDTSFNESGTPGSAPGYQWYAKIGVACQIFERPLSTSKIRIEELDWGYGNSLVETNLPDQVARLDRVHREICGMEDLIQVADEIDLLFKWEHFRTAAKMRRSAPAAIMILGLIPDLQKVPQRNDWFFEDRASFPAYKVDLLLQRPTLLGYKRYQCTPVRAQDLMFELQEYHRLGQSTGPYAYNAVAQGAPIHLLQLTTIYQTGLGKSDTTTSTRKLRGSHVFIRPMKGTSTFFLSKTPVI